MMDLNIQNLKGRKTDYNLRFSLSVKLVIQVVDFIEVTINKGQREEPLTAQKENLSETGHKSEFRYVGKGPSLSHYFWTI